MFDLLIAAVVAAPLGWVIVLAAVVISLAIIGWAWAARPRESKWPGVAWVRPQDTLDRYCIENGHGTAPTDGVYRSVCARCGRVVL